jgi:hypothetical protein
VPIIAWFFSALALMIGLHFFSPIWAPTFAPESSAGPSVFTLVPAKHLFENPPTTTVSSLRSGEYIFSNPLIAADNFKGAFDGQIFVVTQRQGWVMGFDLTGKLLWRFYANSEANSRLQNSVISGSTVLVTTLNGKVYALDRLNGELLWAKRFGLQTLSVQGDFVNHKVYVGILDFSNQWVLSEIDPQTGELLATRLAPICPDIDSADFFIRNETVWFYCKKTAQWTLHGDSWQEEPKLIDPLIALPGGRKLPDGALQATRRFANGVFYVLDSPARLIVFTNDKK